MFFRGIVVSLTSQEALISIFNGTEMLQKRVASYTLFSKMAATIVCQNRRRKWNTKYETGILILLSDTCQVWTSCQIQV